MNKAYAGRRRRGVAAIEFAMLIVVFLNFAVGSLELMLMFSSWSMLQGVTDQVARQEMVLGAASATTAGAVLSARSAAAAQGYPSSTGVSFSAAEASCVAAGTQQCMTIVGTYTYQFKLLTMGLVSMPLSSRSVAPLS